MATMLRSAAMTLLSKTLLSFLYKYLSDVDVEGVEMPSLYGSAEGPGSGWGVRLSNVKLREGAELMTLPGSRKPKKPKPKATTPEGDNQDTPLEPPNIATANGSNREGKKEIEIGSNIDRSEEDISNVPQGYNTPIRQKAVGYKTKRNPESIDVATSATADDRDGALARKRLDSEYDEDSLSSLPEADSPRPDTPNQDSSISFLSCFAPGSEDAKKHTKAGHRKISEREHAQDAANGAAETRPQEEAKGQRHNQPEDPRVFKLNGNFKAISDEDGFDDTVRRFAEEKMPEGLFDEQDVADENNDGAEDGDTSPPMVLRIGEGGYIGTLDVRLVGRELHVLVEDAFLTLEVVTKPVSNEEPDAPTDDKNAAADSLPTNPADKKPNAPAAPIDFNDLKTTGERIIASNPIARIFSSIPQLFLRDILVRLVVLDESTAETTTDSEEEEKDSDLDNAELIVDVGIGLLSVTDGEDFLSPFNNEDTQSQEGDSSYAPSLKTQTSQSGSSPENEYLERRIRTGKGSDGGIWLNVVSPKSDNSHNHRYENNNKQEESTPGTSPRWARHEWLEATRYCVLRSSGLDIQARIFLGTKKELAQTNSSYLWSEDPETYQGIDHTLYGFDHVVPGPTPSQLPPLAPPLSSRSMDEGDDGGILRSQIYNSDRNGIQSSKIASCFYRVARGMTPTRCTLEHLPCENCKKCWEATCKRTTESVDEMHPLDLVTPMPGLVLSVSFRDPLEVNLDRISLDGLGMLFGLFQKPAEDPEHLSVDPESDPYTAEGSPPVTGVLKEPETTSGGYFSSFFFGSSKSDETPQKSTSLPPAFPTYMKPENIQILGVHVAELRFRVHVMRPDDQERHSTGLSFCYWDSRAECLTLDQQKLSSDEKSFQDTRLDAAIFEMNEFKGTETKILVNTGLPYPTADKDILTLASLRPSGHSTRPPWPTTACALLDVPPTFESMLYESRERHGLQIRLLSVTDNPEKDFEKSRSLINCQVGPAEINLPWPVVAAFTGIKDEILKSLLREDETLEDTETIESTTEEKPADTAKQFRVQLGGGRVRLGTMIDVRLPLTRFAGDICPESGVSMESLMERADLSYGTSSDKLVATANSAKGFSLKRLASLPEHIRLRILLFVEDLEPLEKALGVKQQSNSFLRCSAVNKGLGKVAAKKARKKSATASETSLNRRQELVNKLLTLDDDTLQSLWASHQKKQRKTKKTAGAKKGK